MKKIILVAVVVFASLFAPYAQAATANVIKISNKASFDVNLKAVNKIAFTNKAKFDFEVANVVNPTNIATWKMRVSCDGKIDVGFNQTTPNICGKLITIPVAQAKNFSLYMTRQEVKSKGVGFSFKLKAYDKNGKWLHSEEERIRW
ncbi:MAG TPA: hypothetical protein VK145_00275 [Candidatus Nanoarchaeia archaeon]|nr:hypothetical protein [Candidatus Nanoarchaeia archaeon]